MTITEATNAAEWDAFLCTQQYRPFLQSWAMGEVYKRVRQEPVRLMVRDGEKIVGICFGHVVPARRGRHLSIPYGPLLAPTSPALPELLEKLKEIGRQKHCAFIRMSPFWEKDSAATVPGATESPLHLLAEHLWYLPLVTPDPWQQITNNEQRTTKPLTEEFLFSNFRSTTRNLIRRAEKEGVTIERSQNPTADLTHFIALHEETRKRHGFTPYTNSFFRAQMEEFAKTGNATLYMARYQGEIIASSMHVHMGGETSYHHGASTHKYQKIPASYLLQWTAIRDALRRGDHVYNFWGIAPGGSGDTPIVKKHPFAGVTLFKTGFGGRLLELTHCRDIPLSNRYYLTKAIEVLRKWKRGF